MYRLSQFGMSKEERQMLQERLYPQVNEFFMKGIAKKNNLDVQHIETLDYTNNDLFKQQKLLEQRQLKAKFIKDKNIDTSEWDYKWKSIEEAQELDKESQHIDITNSIKPLEELESQYPIEKYIEEELISRD
jgi:hypothetical protein